MANAISRGDPLGRPCSLTNIYLCSKGQALGPYFKNPYNLASKYCTAFLKMARPSPTCSG